MLGPLPPRDEVTLAAALQRKSGGNSEGGSFCCTICTVTFRRAAGQSSESHSAACVTMKRKFAARFPSRSFPLRLIAFPVHP